MIYCCHWGNFIWLVLLWLFLYFCVNRRKNFILSFCAAFVFLVFLSSKRGENGDIFVLLYPLCLYLCLRHYRGIFDLFKQFKLKFAIAYFLAMVLCACAFVWANVDYQNSINTQAKFFVALWSVLCFWILSKGATKLTEPVDESQLNKLRKLLFWQFPEDTKDKNTKA